MKKTLLNIRFLAAAMATLFCLASCDTLQDTLSSEQKKDQEIDVGKISAPTSVFYYNGKAANGTSIDSVKGSEAHLVLGLNQFADATDAKVSYILSYKLNNITRKAEGTGTGTLSTSRSKYYIDLSPAINLIDGTGDVKDADISLSFTVIDLKNASGNKFNGFSFPKFTKEITFEPLYKNEELSFSTKKTSAGASFTIPLNGPITEVDKTVTVTQKSGTIPATTFTASVSADGTKILLTSSADLTGADFAADFALTGIKPVGSKEGYSYTFTNVLFKPLSVTVDGVLNEEAWQTATVSSECFASPENYNLKKIYVTNDTVNLYIALEGDLSFEQYDRIVVMIDNTSIDAIGKSSSDTDYNNFYGPATSCLFSSVDFYLCHILKNANSTSEMQDYKWLGDEGRSDVKTSAKSSSEQIIEYQIPLTSITGTVAGNKLKVFVSTGAYAYTDNKNTLTLKDCIPASAAAIVKDGNQTVTFNLGSGLSYTVK